MFFSEKHFQASNEELMEDLTLDEAHQYVTSYFNSLGIAIPRNNFTEYHTRNYIHRNFPSTLSAYDQEFGGGGMDGVEGQGQGQGEGEGEGEGEGKDEGEE